MNIKQQIKRIFFITLWVVAGAGVSVLLVAAIRIKREKVCKGFEIRINGVSTGQRFTDRNKIVRLLTDNGKETLKGKVTREFDLLKLETRLEEDKWIRDAELFFDNKQVLQVKITERVPIARVITETGKSFYIDSSCTRLPLSDKLSARVPVFTGFPSDKTSLKQADRLLLVEIRKLGSYILDHPFWMAQVSQVDINDQKNFEIIPTIGNHIIQFGNGNECDEKFRKLFLFYRQVLGKIGMEQYATIDVQYDGQVIGVRRNFLSKMDSIKFVKDIQHLVASSRKMDSVMYSLGQNSPKISEDSIQVRAKLAKQ